MAKTRFGVVVMVAVDILPRVSAMIVNDRRNGRLKMVGQKLRKKPRQGHMCMCAHGLVN